MKGCGRLCLYKAKGGGFAFLIRLGRGSGGGNPLTSSGDPWTSSALGAWSGRARATEGWWREAKQPIDDCGAARLREAAEQTGLAGGRARVAGWWLSELEWPVASHRELVRQIRSRLAKLCHG
ncbi:hypothetical protein E2562_028361 [Oryza meyeriana var. granulata]|uniref:Uncharacterized protein n=1 Tax=Oryza meyeriana var. granulata TaxID=110450 RepID=A0A6G1D8V4_9ORYZ|nr:hypothetical protein E2562_028361 [Oryza meyeriana var. granulata]